MSAHTPTGLRFNAKLRKSFRTSTIDQILNRPVNPTHGEPKPIKRDIIADGRKLYDESTP